ncbi:MAG: DUF503 domain-containing protein [Actinomycetota bacterium]|nr:DUF503 domain-containing protein [Actinomycetota bacterium]MDI6822087.1 DUF503 domain-containing protein [Actinomycetota bacterium]
MIIGVARLELFLPECRSLKEKRQIIKSIIDRIGSKYSVSIAEIDNHGLWQRATLGIACVSLSNYQAQRILSDIERYVENLNKATVLNHEVTLLSP